MNMLYCGMANDIISPFLLPIDFDKLYVIDTFDFAYSPDGTLEGQRKEILDQLKAGKKTHDEDYIKELNYVIKKSPKNSFVKNELEKFESKIAPCKIISQEIEGDKWSVVFEQNGKIKEIIVFSGDFCEKWPEEINNITHLTSFGAVFPISNNDMLNEMIKTRCAGDCVFYFQEYSLGENPQAKCVFDKVIRDIFSCNINSHMPLLKYLFVDNDNKNNIQEIPQELIELYKNHRVKCHC